MAPERRSEVRVTAARSGSLQRSQRHARPSGWGHPAAADRPASAGRGAGNRPGGSPRRRRIRRAAAWTPTLRVPRRWPRISCGVLQTPFMLEGQPIAVDASIGIAVAPEHGQDADTLLRCADVAMYQAKRSGTGVAVYSRAEDGRHRPDRLALLGELRHAIDDDELLAALPAQAGPARRHAGRRRGAGALAASAARVPAAGEFIPLAELSGLIHPLSLWVLDAALRQQQAWRGDGSGHPGGGQPVAGACCTTRAARARSPSC